MHMIRATYSKNLTFIEVYYKDRKFYYFDAGNFLKSTDIFLQGNQLRKVLINLEPISKHEFERKWKHGRSK